ncbi:MAG TPA: hypothetical protein VGN57_08490 [Pirellulaceae bacterium]|jgi:hypothetical protein|nr:hypothetical protein [Pirellulaceae bacterium]
MDDESVLAALGDQSGVLGKIVLVLLALVYAKRLFQPEKKSAPGWVNPFSGWSLFQLHKHDHHYHGPALAPAVKPAALDPPPPKAKWNPPPQRKTSGRESGNVDHTRQEPATHPKSTGS